MSVSVKRQTFRCWSCGASGDAVQFVRDYLHVSFAEAVEQSCVNIKYADDSEEGETEAVNRAVSKLLGRVKEGETVSISERGAQIRKARALIVTKGIDFGFEYMYHNIQR